MSEILGYDIDGKPLRAGDRVLLLIPRPKFLRLKGRTGIVEGPSLAWWESDDTPEVHVSFPGDVEGDARCKCLRRLDDRTDHQLSGESFEALMNRLKSGDIVQRPEGVVA